jgi:hypothetical protein
MSGAAVLGSKELNNTWLILLEVLFTLQDYLQYCGRNISFMYRNFKW